MGMEPMERLSRESERRFSQALQILNATVRSVDDTPRAYVALAKAKLCDAAIAGMNLDTIQKAIEKRLIKQIREWNTAQSKRPAIRNRHHPNPTGHHGYYSEDEALRAIQHERRIIGILSKPTKS